METWKYAQDFGRDTGHPSDQDGKINCMERTFYMPNGLWNQSAEMMILNFGENGHSVLRATSALDRGSLKSKKEGKLSIHCNGDSSTAELMFRTLISVNLLSVYEAISDWCAKFAQQISDTRFSSTEKLVAT